MSEKFEKLLDLLVNEEKGKAEDLFHEIVVDKSREIYEELVSNDAETEKIKEKKDEEVDETKEKLRMNNIYKGTKNYRDAKKEATFHGNWENQMRKNCLSAPNIKFIRVCCKDTPEFRFTPKKLKDVTNMSMIFYEDFEVLLKAWSRFR